LPIYSYNEGVRNKNDTKGKKMKDVKLDRDWIKIVKHLRAKGFGPLEAENEATRCLNEIDEEYENNFSKLNKLNNLWK
tara:strand:+ start:251 stop:484 length:234 start_codon:yes stop_codon:yes gene_type:complete